MIRTFIAVELPQTFQEQITKIESELNMPGIKVVDPSIIHITMKFLGDVAEEKIAEIVSALEKIECKPFRAKIKGIGAFPKPSYIRVIWLGAEGDFGKLNTEVERVLEPFRFKKDNEKFTAHATLARAKQITAENKAKILQTLKKYENIEFGEMDVTSISLKKSTLMPKGPVYETLAEIKLK